MMLSRAFSALLSELQLTSLASRIIRGDSSLIVPHGQDIYDNLEGSSLDFAVVSATYTPAHYSLFFIANRVFPLGKFSLKLPNIHFRYFSTHIALKLIERLAVAIGIYRRIMLEKPLGNPIGASKLQ